jgi:hypothetical protein
MVCAQEVRFERGRPLRKTVGLLIFAVIVAAPNNVQAASGAAALQYYVGTWSCRAGAIGKVASKSTAIYTFDSGLLHEWVDVPLQGKMTTPYLNSIATSYDAIKRRYVQTGMDNEGFWWVSFAQPWTGNTEQWVNHASSDNVTRHYTWVRTNRNSFSFTEYPSPTATKPDFKGTCSRWRTVGA